MERTNSTEKTLIQERLKAGGEGDNIGHDDWMESLTQWTWVWASFGRWWRTGKPGLLQSMRSQSWDMTGWLNSNKNKSKSRVCPYYMPGKKCFSWFFQPPAPFKVRIITNYYTETLCSLPEVTELCRARPGFELKSCSIITKSVFLTSAVHRLSEKWMLWIINDYNYFRTQDQCPCSYLSSLKNSYTRKVEYPATGFPLLHILSSIYCL